MKKITTPKNFDKKKEEVVVPSLKTLEFIKQFSRAYYVNNSIPKEMNGLCLN